MIYSDLSTLFENNGVTSLTIEGTVNGNAITYTDDDLFSASLEEGISSSSSFSFGTCEASCLKLSLVGTNYANLKGITLKVSITVNTSTMPIGQYVVDSCKPSSDRISTEIVAYDKLYTVNNKNVLNAYNNAFSSASTLTIKAFREAFFTYLGFTVDTSVSLPNDSVSINKTISANSLKGSDVIQWICELGACFPMINRDGKLTFKTLSASTSSNTYDLTKTSPVIPVFDMTYEDYTVKRYDGIKYSDYSYGSTSNVYDMSSNSLISNFTETQFNSLASNLLTAFSSVILYTPFEIQTLGNPCVETGDVIKFNDGTYSYLLSRTIDLATCDDTFKCEGDEYGADKFNEDTDVQTEITELRQKVDETVKSSYVEYALGDDSTSAPTSGWATSSPTWTKGKYIWQRTVTEYVDGRTPTYSNAVCIQGAKGETGDPGNTPTITGSKSGTQTTIYSDGTKIATIDDGETPTASVSKTGNTATITINGNSVTVTDGENGTSLTNRGNWSSSSISYKINDYVYYTTNKTSYVCKSDHTSSSSILPTNTTYWTILSTSGSDATQYYIHYVYVDDTSAGTNYSTSATRKYIGTYTDTSSADASTWAIAKAKSGIVWSQITGDTGGTGTTYTPSVSSDGVISWTNDGGKTNPQSVNIKGATGSGVTTVKTVYYTCATPSTSTWPTKPDSSATIKTSAEYNAWCYVMCEYSATYPYTYTCEQTTKTDGSIEYGTVVYDTFYSNKIKAVRIDTDDLFAQSIIASNMNITGGSIDVSTSAGTEDKIQLVYKTSADLKTIKLRPLGTVITNYNYSTKILQDTSLLSGSLEFSYQDDSTHTSSIGIDGANLNIESEDGDISIESYNATVFANGGTLTLKSYDDTVLIKSGADDVKIEADGDGYLNGNRILTTADQAWSSAISLGYMRSGSKTFSASGYNTLVLKGRCADSDNYSTLTIPIKDLSSTTQTFSIMNFTTTSTGLRSLKATLSIDSSSTITLTASVYNMSSGGWQYAYLHK